MDSFSRIIVGFVATIGCLAVALFLTWVFWEMQIEERIIHCPHFGISDGYWESIESHQAAGDKLLAGWSWEKLKLWRDVYLFAFGALWTAGSVIISRILNSIVKEVTGKLDP